VRRSLTSHNLINWYHSCYLLSDLDFFSLFSFLTLATHFSGLTTNRSSHTRSINYVSESICLVSPCIFWVSELTIPIVEALSPKSYNLLLPFSLSSACARSFYFVIFPKSKFADMSLPTTLPCTCATLFSLSTPLLLVYVLVHSILDPQCWYFRPISS